MDIHKPKPFHNLREFASEVVIIVVGVAIALAGEQAIERRTWHKRAEEARQAIALELGEDLGQGEERAKLGPCIAARLDLLGHVVDRAAATGRLPPLGRVGEAPIWTWNSDVWRSAQASQVVAHLPEQEQSDIASAYQFVTRMHDSNEAERTPWARLGTLAGPGRVFPAEEAVVMRAALAEAGALNVAVSHSGLRLRQQVDAGGISFDSRLEREYANTPVPSARECESLGTVPVAYASSASNAIADDLANVRAHPITRASSSGGGTAWTFKRESPPTR